MKILLLTTLLALLMACSNEHGGELVNKSEQIAALKAVAQGALLVDVRSEDEIEAGMLIGAIHIKHDVVVPTLLQRQIDKDSEIVLYCRSGNRAGIAEKALQEAGFTHIINAGGYTELKAIQAAIDSQDTEAVSATKSD